MEEWGASSVVGVWGTGAGGEAATELSPNVDKV